MITSKVDHCRTLEEFYSEIRRQQEEAHGKEYCAHHDAIQKLLIRGDRYKELGTHQGATAAAACLAFPDSVELIDINHEKYYACKSLFETYCFVNKINLIVKEVNSIDPASVSRCDLLLIDSVHRPDHLRTELMLHAPYTSKYIVLHDTYILSGRVNPVLHETAVMYTKWVPEWSVIEYYQKNAGYTVLKRK
jgi:hypothetical protein